MIQVKYVFKLRYLQFTYDNFSIVSPSFQRDSSMPNNSSFNRMNKFEMVCLINSLQRVWNIHSKEECLRMETLIREYMPETINKQIDVADWLGLNWNSNLDCKKFQSDYSACQRR